MKTRAPEKKPPLLLRLYQAQRALAGGLDDPEFIQAVTGSGGMGGFLSRLQHPAMEVRLKSRVLRGGGRDLVASDPYARQFLRMCDLYVGGPTGTTVSAEVLRPQADGTGLEPDVEINAAIDAAWEDFWTHPVTTDRRHTGPAAEHLYTRTMAGDGDVFVRMFDGYPNRHWFAIQFVDADQIDTELNREAYGSQREIRMGCELDEYGAETGFWVRDYPNGHGYGYGRRREPYFVPAYDFRDGTGEMLHGGIFARANQLRSLSWFSGVIEMAEKRLDYTDAVLTAALRSAVAPWALESQVEHFSDLQQTPPPPPVPGQSLTQQQIEERANYYAPRLTLDRDTIKAIPAGWKLSGVPNEHPTANYPPFLKSTAREYACWLGPTYESLANDRESTNYGSLRGGMKLEQKYFQYLQQHAISAFLTPIRQRWLRNSMLRGLATGGAEGLLLPQPDWRLYTRTAFDPPPQEWIDPLKDIESVALELELKLTSHTEVARRLGRRWADVAQKIADDLALAKKKGFSIDPAQAARKRVSEEIAKEDAKEEAAAAANPNGGGDGGQ